jgi:hypothetical protein
MICSVERMRWEVISSDVAVGFRVGSLNAVGGYVAAILQKAHGGGAFESIIKDLMCLMRSQFKEDIREERWRLPTEVTSPGRGPTSAKFKSTTKNNLRN